MMVSSDLERSDLPCWILNVSNGSKGMFGESRWVRVFSQSQNALLDVGREAQEHEHLSHTGTGDALPASDLGLGGDRA